VLKEGKEIDTITEYYTVTKTPNSTEAEGQE
jgi:hypothetical protein